MSFPEAYLYSRKKDNDLSLGPEFENQAILNMFLTLRENEALGREVDEPSKFDDIVIRVRNEGHFEYYFRQLKHKDTEKNSNQVITWNDLLSCDKKNPFNLREYFYSYLNFSQNSNLLVKELSIVTTITFSTAITYTNTLSDLSQIARNVENQSKKLTGPKQVNSTSRNTYYVTQCDLEKYFVEYHGTVGNICGGSGKRFKFNERGIGDLVQSLISSIPLTAEFSAKFREFLELLVFDVDQPHANKLKKINKSILKQLFPFYLDLNSQERSDQISRHVLQLFKPVQGNLAKWITFEDQRSSLNEFILEFKKEAILGSVKSYEDRILTRLYEHTKLEELKISEASSPWIHTLQTSLKNLNESKPLSILNIHNDEANPTVISLKLLKAFISLSIRNKTLLVQVTNAEAIENIVNHFEKLHDEVSTLDVIIDTFCFVIEFSQFFKPVEDINVQLVQLVNRLSRLIDLRKWIHFVVLTKYAIPYQSSISLKHIRDLSLKWNDLPGPTKKHLFRKKIFVENNKETSLEVLGFREECLGIWIDPTTLAELIIHEERRPLFMGLPTSDDNLASIYIDRQLKLPVVDTENMNEDLKNRLVFNKEVYNQKIYCDSKSTYHLLVPVEFPKGISTYLWAESSGQQEFQELQQYVTRSLISDYLLPESKLLDENSCFGNGSDGGKLVIVVDLPGKGKSCLLTSLTNNFTKKEALKAKLSRILYRVNLLECPPSMWDKGDVITDEITAIRFLVDHLIRVETRSTSDSASNYLTISIIKNMCLNGNHKSIFLLLDGFDEITDKQRDVTLKMINFLKEANGIIRIILTSRPDNGLGDKLESYFQQFSLHLTNFDTNDQINYLTKRWKLSIQEYQTKLKLKRVKKKNRRKYKIFENSVNDDSLIRQFADALVIYSQHTLTDEDKTFLDIPLQCMIVSECFFEDLKQYLTKYPTMPLADSYPKFNDENFELLRLYGRFYETKIDIMFREKANLIDANMTSALVKKEMQLSLTEALKRLSVFHIMKNIQCAGILYRLDWFDYRKSLYAQDLERAMKLGMIHGLDVLQTFTHLETPNVKFIHRTFAEYFFAKFLTNHFTETNSGLLDSKFIADKILEKTMSIIIEQIFVETEYAGVRRFFDRMLSDFIPEASDRCPFTIDEDKTKIFVRWPSVSHAKFNQSIAELAVREYSEMFKTARLEKDCLTSELMRRSLPNGLIGGLDSFAKTTPSIALMLVLGIKEFAARSEIPNNTREILAYCILMTITKWFTSSDINFSESFKRIFTALLLWFDPVEKNEIFSEYFFKILNHLIENARTLSELGALSLACSIVKHHASSSQFYTTMKSLTETKIVGPSSISRIANVVTRYVYLERAKNIANSESNAKETGFFFHNLLSFGNWLSPMIILPELQLEWFLNLLDESSLDIEAFHTKPCILNPFTLMEVFNFHFKVLKESNDSKSKKAHPFESCLRYIDRMLDFLATIPETADAEHERLKRSIKPWQSKNSRDFKDAEAKSKESKWTTTTLASYYLMISDQFAKHLPNESTLRFFMKSIGRCVLIGMVNRACCRRYGTLDFGRLNFYQRFLMAELEPWLKEKLHQLWDAKGEIDFINFLFQDERQQTTPGNQEDLTCLVFSDLVAPFIPDKFSEHGLEHFRSVIQRLRTREGQGTLLELFERGKEAHVAEAKQKIGEITERRLDPFSHHFPS